MEKIKLNNQVILMRKHVKQAKVHCINKLVKQVKLLQNRKGNEDQVLKAKRKAERFLEEISLIKKMKPDSISKLALSKDKNWKDVLLMKNCPIEDRCVAMLANYEPVQKEVEIFLNSNKDLASKVAILFKEWEEKNKLNKDSVQKKKPSLGNLKNKTIVQNKNFEETQENFDEMINELDVHSNDIKREVSSIKKFQNNLPIDSSSKLKRNKSTVKKKKDPNSEFVGKKDIEQQEESDLKNKPKVLISNEGCEAENNYETDSQLKLKTDCDVKETSADRDDFVMSENESGGEEVHLDDVMEDDFGVFNAETKSSAESSEDSLPSNKLKQSDFKHSPSFKVNDSIGLKSGDSKVKAITMLNLDDLKDLEEIPVNDNIKNDESSEENQTDEDSTDDESPNDPFFLGRDEAVSVENKLVDDPNSKKYRSVDKIFDRKEKSFDPPSFENKSQRPMNRSQKREFLRAKTFNKDKFFHKNDQKSQNWNKNGFEKNNSKGRFQPYNQYRNERDFKKKSVPNQNENKKSNYIYQRKELKNSPSKNINPLRKEADSKALHPSWEAKRKQKESINTSFQGKRMVFED